MMVGVLACWLAVGLLVLADSRRFARVMKRAHRGTIVMRCGGTALLALSALVVGRDLGVLLGIAAFYLSFAVVLSVAVVSFSRCPRAYAATLPVAGIIALLLFLR